MNKSLRDPYLWLTLLLSMPVIAPLLQPGYFWGGHDARHSVYFLYQFDKAIQDGIWYPRWAPDFAFGYGYPFFNIYGPLSSYVGEMFHLLGFDIVTSVKIVFGLSALASGLTMYLFGRAIFNQQAGLIAALIYVYLPYHLFDLYVRAALAESVGFVFVPLTMWGFYRAVTAPRLDRLVWTAIAYAALMFTSNLLALIFTPILGLYVATMIVWQFWQDPTPPPPAQATLWQRLWRFPNRYVRVFHTGIPPLSVLLLGLGISGIFWLPAFFEYRYVRVDQWVGGRFAFGDDFVALFQLFSPKWGFGTSIPGPDDDVGFQLGLPATILFLLSFLAVQQLTTTPLRRTLIIWQALTLGLIFLTTPLSYPIWAVLPLSSFAQFPWRLLVVIAPLLSILAGAVLVSTGSPNATDASHARPELVEGGGLGSTGSPRARATFPLPFIGLACLIILASYPYLQAQSRDPQPTEGPVSQLALFRFQQSADEMTGQTAWTRDIPNWSALAEQVAQGGEISTKVNYSALPNDGSVGVYSMQMNSVRELLWVGTQRATAEITFFIPYYPGWRAYLYQDLGPHDGNLDETIGPVTRIGPRIDQLDIQTTPREGWMSVTIPQGSHFLEIRFEDTIIRQIGKWTSLSAVMFTIIALIFSYIQLRPKEEAVP